MIRQDAEAKLTLGELMDAQRPPLFSRMPSMLRGDGMMADSLQHEFYYVGNIDTHPVAVSVQQWKVALQTSHILRGHRRSTSRAH